MGIRDVERQEKYDVPFDLSLALSEPKFLDVYANDVVVKRELNYIQPSKGKKGTRHKITELSHKALKRLAFFASNCVQKFHIMITLTYPENHTNDGELVKEHLNHFMMKLRRKRKNLKHFWFLEFQANGSPHFHLMLSTKFIEMDWIGLAWNDIVCPDNPDHLKAGTRVERIRKQKGGRNYAVKYATKCWQKTVPQVYKNVGRFWGHSQGIEPRITHSIQVHGYDDCQYELRHWKNACIINHDVIITVLWNVAKYLPVPKL